MGPEAGVPPSLKGHGTRGWGTPLPEGTWNQRLGIDPGPETEVQFPLPPPPPRVNRQKPVKT